jgi:hypothetical protein
MEVKTILKSLGTVLKVIMDTLAQATYLILVFRLLSYLDEVPSASQIKKDARALYGALLSACGD